MDVLSDVIAVMRTGEPRSARIRRHAPWGQRYSPVPGAGFQVILQGSCWLIPAASEPIAIILWIRRKSRVRFSCWGVK